MGGIYDQLGGGFCRYSTDEKWKVPHFEKMLYDNGQLVSLFSEAALLYKNEDYKNIVYQTLSFIKRELYEESTGCFYSSLDADSEGEEGKFYVWKKEELKKILNNNFDVFSEYYRINSSSLWEGKYILQKTENIDAICKKYNLSNKKLNNVIDECNQLLMNVRDQRVRPGLDDKSITSWNAIMLKGYVDAFKSFNDSKFLEIAKKNGDFIINNQKKKDGGLYHSFKKGKSTINGFLEDYSFTIEAFISLYEITFNEKWIKEAEELMKYSIEKFLDEESGMFFFTSIDDEKLIARKFEITDNVIPASNSSMAKSLFYIGKITLNSNYIDMSRQLLHNIKKDIDNYGPGYSNWSILFLDNIYSFYEVAIVGERCDVLKKEILQNYLPNKILIGSKKESDLSILKEKYNKNKTFIYVCENGICNLPTRKTEEAIKLLNYKKN